MEVGAGIGCGECGRPDENGDKGQQPGQPGGTREQEGGEPAGEKRVHRKMQR